jgi:hypothetical protein
MGDYEPTRRQAHSMRWRACFIPRRRQRQGNRQRINAQRQRRRLLFRNRGANTFGNTGRRGGCRSPPPTSPRSRNQHRDWDGEGGRRNDEVVGGEGGLTRRPADEMTSPCNDEHTRGRAHASTSRGTTTLRHRHHNKRMFPLNKTKKIRWNYTLLSTREYSLTNRQRQRIILFTR